MRSLSYRAAAIRDVQGIADTTRERWDEDQARIYSDRIRTDISRLREFALRYTEYTTRSGETFLKMRTGSHIVFYVATAKNVEIVRILPARADFTKFLV